MSANSKKIFVTTLVSIFLFTGRICAHCGEGHHGSSQKSEEISEDEKIAFQIINERYLKTVKPIFEAKCFACHATTNQRLPWYSEIPFVKDLIQNDIAEAKEHMDMTKDFPFNGHGTSMDDLETIRTEIEKGEMPPARYWMVHWKSRVSEDELGTIRDWTQFGEATLKKIQHKNKGENEK